MRSIASLSAAALSLAHAALAQNQATGPIPIKTEVIRFDRPLEGSLTSADNRWSNLLFDCFNLTVPERMPRIELALESDAEQDLTIAYLEGHDCEVTEDSMSWILPAGDSGKGEISGQMSLFVGSEKPVSYRLSAFAFSRDNVCVHRRGSRELTPAQLAFGTFEGKPDLVPAVQHGETLAVHSAANYPDARGLDWFVDNDEIGFGSVSYKKYGLPRVLGAQEIEFFAEKDGVFVGKEKGLSDADVDVLYVMIDQAGCEFQPYQKKVAD